MLQDFGFVSLFFAGLCLLVGGWVALWLWSLKRSVGQAVSPIDRLPAAPPATAPGASGGQAELPRELARLRKNLRLKTLGNETAIERLVARERERFPAGNPLAWHRMAIESWEEDNR